MGRPKAPRPQLSGLSSKSFRTIQTLSDDEAEEIRVQIEDQIRLERQEKETTTWTSMAMYILIFLRLVPKEEENRTFINIGLRVAQYAALIPDMGASIYSIRTFTGISHCCGKPLLNFGSDGGINWCKVFFRLTYIYMILVVLEIYPVVQTGLPFNLINPPIGFFLTIVLFFDDGKETAFIMWFLEVLAVSFEFVVLRLKMRKRVQLETELSFLKQAFQRKMHEHETQEQYRDFLAGTTRLLWDLGDTVRKEDRLIRLLKAALVLNTLLIITIFIIILLISRAGGLCINSEMAINPFVKNQLARCDMCDSEIELCEICGDMGEQCYFPYK